MILRIVLSFVCFKLLVSREYDLFEVAIGLLYAYLAIMFLALKPYKVNWVNHTDGAISLLLAFFSLTCGLKTKIIYIVGFVSGLSIALIGSLYYGIQMS